MNNYELVILIKLVISHIIADFFLQPNSWVTLKSKNKIKSATLYVHCLISGVLAYLIIADWQAIYILFYVFGTHLIIDLIKVYFKTHTLSFIVDQLAHILSLIVLYLFISNLIDFKTLLNIIINDKVYVIILGLLLINFPTSKLIDIVYSDIGENLQLNGLESAGKWIGIIERLLTFILVLINQYAAIGFLLVAKSFWFGTKIEYCKKERDYILIGNFISFSIAIIVGLIVNFLIK